MWTPFVSYRNLEAKPYISVCECYKKPTIMHIFRESSSNSNGNGNGNGNGGGGGSGSGSGSGSSSSSSNTSKQNIVSTI